MLFRGGDRCSQHCYEKQNFQDCSLFIASLPEEDKKVKSQNH